MHFPAQRWKKIFVSFEIQKNPSYNPPKCNPQGPIWEVLLRILFLFFNFPSVHFPIGNHIICKSVVIGTITMKKNVRVFQAIQSPLPIFSKIQEVDRKNMNPKPKTSLFILWLVEFLVLC